MYLNETDITFKIIESVSNGNLEPIDFSFEPNGANFTINFYKNSIHGNDYVFVSLNLTYGTAYPLDLYTFIQFDNQTYLNPHFSEKCDYTYLDNNTIKSVSLRYSKCLREVLLNYYRNYGEQLKRGIDEKFNVKGKSTRRYRRPPGL